MSISKLSSPVTPNDVILKANEIIDAIEAAGTAVPSSTTPAMDGTATPGTETDYARGDHVHPHDTSKVDVVAGKGLSENDFTSTLKSKLEGIAQGAEVNVQSDWNVTDSTSDAFIKNKPTIPSAISPATATPEMDGTGAVGDSTKYARENHVHPSDTSKQNRNSGQETSDLDNCLGETNQLCTFYSFTSAASNIPSNAGGTLLVMRYSSSHIYQLAFMNAANTTDALVYARKYNGSFGDWVLISFKTLSVARGGTGRSNLNIFLRSDVSTEDLNGDANNAPHMSVIYVSNATIAASISHLPLSSAGHLITIGGSENRGYQFYLVHNDPVFYMRTIHTTWGSWIKIVDETPTFTTPTVYSSRCTVNSGGWYRIGRRVYVEVSITPAAARNANTAYQYLSGLPVPATTRVPLACSNSNNKGGYTAVITDSGGLAVINGSTGLATTESLVIGGTYLASS